MTKICMDLKEFVPESYLMCAACIAVQVAVVIGGYKIVERVQEKNNCSNTCGKLVRIVESSVVALIMGFVYALVALSFIAASSNRTFLYFKVVVCCANLLIIASIALKTLIITGVSIRGAYLEG